VERNQIRNRIEALLAALSSGMLEREEAVALSLLSAAAGESVFLLGLPGVAKSMVARRLALAFRGARRFEYLMSRFSTPDEIFGPVSISKLKDGDTYERVVDGYLPTADVVFLDEIWKAGPAIQNSLLTALNEKIYRNGREDLRLPLKAVIAASNELPAQGEGLEALWDRFLLRYVVDPIRDKGNFLALVAGRTEAPCDVTEDLRLSAGDLEDLLRWREEVAIPAPVLEFLYAMRMRYAMAAQEELKDRAEASRTGEKPGDGDEEDSVPYVSDRRWKKVAGILRSAALLNGRDAVDWSDCLLLEHLLWDSDTQRERVSEDIADEIVSTLVREAVEAGRPLQAPAGNTGERRPWSPDGGKHYVFVAGGETLRIAAKDYESLDADRRPGRFSDDGTVILCTGPGEFNISRTKPGHVTIGSFSYPLRMEGTNAAAMGEYVAGVATSTAGRIAAFMESVSANLFTRKPDAYPALQAELRRYQGAWSKHR
jgi:MoxR-like ATPase